MRKIFKMGILVVIITITLMLGVKGQPLPEPPIKFDINRFKNLALATVKIGATIFGILIFLISAIRAIWGGAEYSMPSTISMSGLVKLFNAIKKPLVATLAVIVAVWLPDILVYLGLYPNAPFSVDWNQLWSGG